MTEPLPSPAPDSDPLAIFSAWYDRAEAAGEVAAACALATSGARGPSVRMVLIKGLTHGALCVFTSYGSRKAQELDQTGRAAVVYHWPKLGAQVRFEGSARRLSDAESDAYFASRPRLSQLSARVSPQSRPIGSYAELTQARDALSDALGEAPVSRPDDWGGYAISPDHVELWLDEPNRLHRRFAFDKQADGWAMSLLGP
ncbi:MAG: pyridoxamine 5'-phosphate oxidase [Polyangiaceae bacterium]|nr:pyridoxamine 5'-phosphate oxidase [Polyangiaceae bacterium]MCW5792493.1 pyridoxamine 5'-phosphate oxidase [Polyangiaceae bacterium]